jgi:hypothetical protein
MMRYIRETLEATHYDLGGSIHGITMPAGFVGDSVRGKDDTYLFIYRVKDRFVFDVFVGMAQLNKHTRAMFPDSDIIVKHGTFNYDETNNTYVKKGESK